MKLKFIIDWDSSDFENPGFIKMDFEREKLYKKDFKPYYHSVVIESSDGLEILDRYTASTPLWKWKGDFIPGKIIRGTLDGENVVLLLNINDTYYRIFEDG